MFIRSINSYRRITLGFVIIASGLFLSGCVERPVSVANSATVKIVSRACQQGDPMTQTTLYFGLNRPNGPVITAKEWQSFVDNEVTPRFKDGLTVFDAQGQWLGHNGLVAKEKSKALMLIHTNTQESEQAIGTLQGKYKTQFAQESVMRIDHPVCVGF
ncbi:DUF3574 domain-containing protein [Yersinia ruckeri]|uniref:DUF3574 domain-containing protein n=1 Tax=Yersinia ruckeri TaxID=29486 RepID=UPI0020BF1FBC|nr:DUF3574 domain-containing protein [Yersinia ruckeri]MCK8566084.1 DUF3574 domain-containing protein [Yersinia ruckeri]UZY18350.1 DUF3574 domain-containing protein [Yersinia ruckeri]